MTNSGRDADDTAKTEADHLMKWPGCGAWLDLRDLGEVARHVLDRDFEISQGLEAPARESRPQ
jgi:hypothetical protein